MNCVRLVSGPVRAGNDVAYRAGNRMRILYLVGGNDVIAGGATVRDAAFVRGLVEAGHDVDAISLYGPAKIEGETGYSSVFHSLGGRHTLRRFFPTLANVPGALASMVRRPRPVANMTSLAVTGRRTDRRGGLAVSLLSGSSGQQRREFSRLLEHIAKAPGKIDIAILSNIMLSGLSEAIRGNLGCPIVCLSQGSDRAIEALEEPYRSDARKLARKNAKLFRMVVASSRFFAIRATESLALPASRIKVVPPGVDVENMINPAPRRRFPFTIGYMAHICQEKGLDILVDALESLLREEPLDLELRISGKVDDDRYWQRIRRRLDSSALKGKYRVSGSLNGEARREFMESLSVFVVSSREPESRATYLLEAMAAGVPVIGPAAGIIPEIFQYANGGLLVSSDAPAWMLSQALSLMASMPDTADELGQVGAEGVMEHFSIKSTAAKLACIIDEALTAKHIAADPEKRRQ